jgi:Ca2+-binding EF-hand superfamily protein
VSRLQPLHIDSNNQAERLKEKELEMKEIRRLKQTVKLVPHRLDRLYTVTGAQLTPRNRYAVDEEELRQLRSLSLTRNVELYYGKGVSHKKYVKSRTVDTIEYRVTHSEQLEEANNSNNVKQESVDDKLDTDTSAVDTDTREGLDDNEEGENLSHEELTLSDNEEEENDSNMPRFVITAERRQSTVEDQRVMSRLADQALVKRGSKYMIQEVTVLADDEQRAAYAGIFEQLCKPGKTEIPVSKLKEMFPDATSDQLADFYLVFDLDGDKSITLEEFEAVLALNDQLNGIRTIDPCQTVHFCLTNLVHLVRIYKEMFEMVDDDSNGQLSMSELLMLLSAAFGHQVGGDPELAQHIIQTVGKDEHGYIEFVEFLNHIPFFLALHQRICANPLSLDDIELVRDTMRRRITSMTNNSAIIS